MLFDEKLGISEVEEKRLILNGVEPLSNIEAVVGDGKKLSLLKDLFPVLIDFRVVGPTGGDEVHPVFTECSCSWLFEFTRKANRSSKYNNVDSRKLSRAWWFAVSWVALSSTIASTISLTIFITLSYSPIRSLSSGQLRAAVCLFDRWKFLLDKLSCWESSSRRPSKCCSPSINASSKSLLVANSLRRSLCWWRGGGRGRDTAFKKRKAWTHMHASDDFLIVWPFQS